MAEFIIPTWILWAFGIGAAASIGLNGGPFLPGLKELRLSRIEARWVGYAGLTLAFWLWIVVNQEAMVNEAGVAWLIIVLLTLIPNTWSHLYARDNGNGDLPDSDDPHPRRTRLRHQALVENAIATHQELMEAATIIDLALKALYDPQYVRMHDPDRDATEWKRAAKAGKEKG
jgi:hypothetical protein